MTGLSPNSNGLRSYVEKDHIHSCATRACVVAKRIPTLRRNFHGSALRNGEWVRAESGDGKADREQESRIRSHRYSSGGRATERFGQHATKWGPSWGRRNIHFRNPKLHRNVPVRLL